LIWYRLAIFVVWFLMVLDLVPLPMVHFGAYVLRCSVGQFFSQKRNTSSIGHKLSIPYSRMCTRWRAASSRYHLATDWVSPGLLPARCKQPVSNGRK
jgi:hypothetical protein